MMTTPASRTVQIVLSMSIILGVTCVPASRRQEPIVGLGSDSSLEDNSVPGSDFDGVSLLRKTVFGIYKDGVDGLTSRLSDNLNVIDRAVNGENIPSTQLHGTQPNTIEKRQQPRVVGSGTNLPLYVLSKKLAELEYERIMRNIERNEQTFAEHG